MAAIDREVVRHVARLARLRIEPEEEDRALREMERIVDYVDVLARLPQAGTADDAERATSELREDRPIPWQDPEALIAAAPDREGDHLRVPPVLADP